MSNFIEKFNRTPLLVFIIMLKDLKDLVMNIFADNATQFANFDFWDFSIKLFISILLWLVLKAFIKLKRRFDILNIVLAVQNKNAFIRSLDGIDYYKAQNETNEQFLNRIPQGQYNQYVKTEFETLQTIISEKLDIKPSEAQKELNEIYPHTHTPPKNYRKI